MKRLFLAGATVLLITTSAAHAAERLPDTMLGEWCPDLDKSIENRTVYFRTKTHNEPGCQSGEDVIIMRQDRIDAWQNSCSFKTIEQNGGVYQIHEQCVNADMGGVQEEDRFLLEELELVDGQLIITSVSEG
jgi:hypothetical protein